MSSTPTSTPPTANPTTTAAATPKPTPPGGGGDREARIKQALRALADGTYTSIRQAARDFGIPRSTLQGRRLGNTSRARSHGGQQRLSATEEEALARICLQLDAWGGHWPGTIEALECLATKFIEAKELEEEEEEGGAEDEAVGGDADGEQGRTGQKEQGQQGEGGGDDDDGPIRRSSGSGGSGSIQNPKHGRRLGINWNKNFRNRHPEVKLKKKTYNRRLPDGRWIKKDADLGEMTAAMMAAATTTTTATAIATERTATVVGTEDGREGGSYDMSMDLTGPTSGYMPLDQDISQDISQGALQGVPQGMPPVVQQDVVSASYFLPPGSG